MAMNVRLLRPILSGDPDALRYIAAVQKADGATLEPAVKKAITDFVAGCKADGIWSAIKASCILMGARTLSGALTPLAGAAPTNSNFVSGDYARKTGLVSNGSKYIDTGRVRTADGQNDSHAAAFSTEAGIGGFHRFLGFGTQTGQSVLLRGASGSGLVGVAHGNSNITYLNVGDLNNFLGISRAASGSYSYLLNGTAGTVNDASQTRPTTNWYVFNVNPTSVGTNGRIAFYSIGSAVDLALLQTRVSALYTAIGAAI